jgi:hypothetical protein
MSDQASRAVIKAVDLEPLEPDTWAPLGNVALARASAQRRPVNACRPGWPAHAGQPHRGRRHP